MNTIMVNGISMAYEDVGQGVPIVLLHGFCGSAAYWELVRPQLSRFYRVITPDLRGHGATEAGEEHDSIDDMADDVVQLMDNLGISKYTVLGHSMGGYIALSIAERFSARLQGFGLIHSTAFPDSDEARATRLQAVSKIKEYGVSSFVRGLVPPLFAETSREQLPDMVQRVLDIGFGTPEEGACGAALAMRERPDRRDVIASAVLPVLLVAGEHDTIAPPARVFTSSASHITQVVIDRVGHMSMYEAPEKLAEAILSYMQVISKR